MNVSINDHRGRALLGGKKKKNNGISEMPIRCECVCVGVCVNANARAAPASGADAGLCCVFASLVCFLFNVRSTGGIDRGIDR